MKTNKYIHPSLEMEVPISLRREIYKKALKFKRLHSYGLCLTLPVLLWNLKDHLSNNPYDGKSWDYGDTPIAFPELTEERYNRIVGSDAIYQEQIRIRVLKEMLNDVL